jgi:membrane fusion protein
MGKMEKSGLKSLIRSEVFENINNNWMPGIYVRTSIRTATVLWTFIILLLASILFATLCSYTRRERVVGHLTPIGGISMVLAPASGYVERVLVHEGDHVKAKQVLAVIILPRRTTEGNSQERIISSIAGRRKSIQDQLSKLDPELKFQIQDQQRQKALLEVEVNKIEAEISSNKESLKISDANLQAFKPLVEGKFISRPDFANREVEILNKKAQLSALERQRLELMRQIQQNDQSRKEYYFSQVQKKNELEKQLSSLEQDEVENRSKGEYVLEAPIDGIISTQLATPGQAFVDGQPMMSLLPERSSLYAELLVPSRSIGFINIGSAVKIRYQAFPFQKFGYQNGRVSQISLSALSKKELDANLPLSQGDDSYYRVVVALGKRSLNVNAQDLPLRPGMRLEADILLDSRRLIEWIIDPLHGKDSVSI